MVKHLPAMQETQVWYLGWEDPLEKEMATHSSTLAWKISWTEEHGRLQSMGSQRVGHDWAASLSLFQVRKSWKTHRRSSCQRRRNSKRGWVGEQKPREMRVSERREFSMVSNVSEKSSKMRTCKCSLDIKRRSLLIQKHSDEAEQVKVIPE